MFSKLRTIISIARLYLSVSYQLDRFSNGDRRHGNNNKNTPSTPLLLVHRIFSGKRTTRRCDTGTNACHWFFCGYRLPLRTTFAWCSLIAETMFHLVFCVENIFPVFTHTPYTARQTKSVCVIKHHQCVCSYSCLYYLHEYKLMLMCPN